MSTDTTNLSDSENYETVLQMPLASQISVDDVLYLIQGTGDDRDRQMLLSQLVTFLQTAFSKITMTVKGGQCVLQGDSLTYTETSTGKTVSLAFGDGLKIEADGGVAQVDGGSISFTAKSGAQVILSYNDGLEVLNAAGELLYGISRSGEITGSTITGTTLVGSYSYGAGFKNAAAGNYATDVTHNSMLTLVAANPGMKYFARLANGTGTRTAFTIDVGTSTGYQIGEEIVIFNATGSSISVKNSAGNQIAELEGGAAAKFMLIMVDSSETNATWIHVG